MLEWSANWVGDLKTALKKRKEEVLQCKIFNRHSLQWKPSFGSTGWSIPSLYMNLLSGSNFAALRRVRSNTFVSSRTAAVCQSQAHVNKCVQKGQLSGVHGGCPREVSKGFPEESWKRRETDCGEAGISFMVRNSWKTQQHSSRTDSHFSFLSSSNSLALTKLYKKKHI